MSDAEIERAITKAIRKHIRDDTLHDALIWFKARVEAYKALERLG